MRKILNSQLPKMTKYDYVAECISIKSSKKGTWVGRT